MLFRSLLSATASAVVVALQITVAHAAGTLKVTSAVNSALTVEYTTDAPHDKNWIGLYNHAGGGPVDQKKDQESLVWKYTPGTSGKINLPMNNLPSGKYKLFFLAKDGYAWVTNPIDATYSKPFQFLLGNAILRNSRVGNTFQHKVSGLFDGEVTGVTFSKASGAGWLSVSSEGMVSGTPPAGSTDSTVVVRAAKGDSSATIELQVPVQPADKPLVDRLRVMTYNMWGGGTNVNNHHAKQVKFFASSDLDIVAFQETNDGKDAKRVAEALGWYLWTEHRTVAVVSRYKIETVHGPTLSHAGGVRIAMADARINVWVGHLGFEPYGPYDFCFDKMSVSKVMEREGESGRTGQITDTLAAMKGHLDQADTTPVLLLGDFNAPSHLDYTEALKSKNCGYSNVPWPTSKKPTDAGLKDSFRVANPDPSANQALTWSPIVKKNEGRNEPQDRIDFIYFKGKKLSVQSSKTVVVGTPKEKGSHQDNEWTTDHAAVVTEFNLSA